ncbi:tRNA-dihydrouridine synthase [Chloroflexota bacterium]
MNNIDLSVEVNGLTFRNPIMPGSSDIILDERGVIKCLEQGIGAILTKSFSSLPGVRTRARPWHFNYRVFGKGLENNWISRGGFHPMSAEQAAEKLIPKMASLCRDEGTPFIVSIADGADVNEWVTDAKRFEQAGANMLELNFSCPHAGDQIGEAAGRTLGQNLPIATEIISSVKKAVKIPISTKPSVSWDPFAPYIQGYVAAGSDFLTAQNTVSGMLIDVEEEVPFGGLGSGGYQMGRSLLPFHLNRVVETRKLTDAPIIATGGVWTATDAIMYLLIGCHLVQVAGAVCRKGYGLFGQIIKGIEEWMQRKGYSSIEDFRGKVFDLATKVSSSELIHMEWPFPMPQERSSSVIPVVDLDKCIFCCQCHDFCLSGVFTVNKPNRTVDVDHENKCWGCGDCVGWCPANAIKMIDKDTKEVVWDNHGLAKPYRPENWKK